MLSPLKPSAPSASLLRFLRSQSGLASHGVSCPRPNLQLPCPKALTSSRRASNLAYRNPCQSRATWSAMALALQRASPLVSAKPMLLHSPALTRSASTSRRPLLRRLLDLRRGKNSDIKNHRNHSPTLTDEGTELFNLGRGLAAKASNELRLRCTEFDKSGNVTLVNGEFRKSELIAKVSRFCSKLKVEPSCSYHH